MQPGIRIGKGDHRPWLEKWKFVLHHLDRLRRYYESDLPDTGNLDVEAWATGFFVECDHLVDWLSQDISALGGVTDKQIRDFARNTEPLQRCDAIQHAQAPHEESANEPYRSDRRCRAVGWPLAGHGRTGLAVAPRWTDC